jgi:DNA modification methylase
VTIRVVQGHAPDVLAQMEAESAHLCVTSPPYLWLRSYGTPPQIWPNPDGTPLCPDGAHEWEDIGKSATRLRNGIGSSLDLGGNKGLPHLLNPRMGALCDRCGCWRGELGSEPTVDRYVAGLVSVFEAVRRVLRRDGLCWVNLSGSYFNNPGGQNGGANNTLDYGAGRVSPKVMEANRQAGRQDRIGAAGKESWLKPLDWVDTPGLFAHAMQRAGWYWRADIALVKCLSGGTRLYAQTTNAEGPMMLKDLVRLDPLKVKLWNGERWTQVLAWTKHAPAVTKDERHAASRKRINARRSGEEAAPSDYLEVVFRNGECIGCTPEHRWPTQRGLVPASALQVGDVVPSVRLPGPAITRQPKALDDEDIGWFVGFYLAEGWRDHKALHFACHQRETAAYDRIKRIAADFHGSATWRTTTKNGATINVSGRFLHAIIDTYLRSEGAKRKQLASACWQRSDVFLRALMQGYLEGDGHWRKSECFWSLGFTRNDELAADLRTLAARLGMRLTIKAVIVKSMGREFPVYRGWLRYEPSTSVYARAAGEVVAIRASRARTFWDVTVEDDPHTFALASGLLTHNSNPLPESVQGTRWERCRVKVAGQKVSPPGTYKGDAYQGAHGRAQGAVGYDPARGGTYFDSQAQWADCPGCSRCAPNDGLILRRGNGRPTRAWERFLVFARAPSYFYDTHAVREPMAASSLGRLSQDVAAQEGSWRANGGAKMNGSMKAVGNPASGRNHRDWMFWPTAEAQLKEAHYASYPPGLVEFAVKAATSAAGVCPSCLAPHARVIAQTETIGWRPTCTCSPILPPVPATVLDPFVGSGTSLMVADRLGRNGVGIDLAQRRIVNDAPLFVQLEVVDQWAK